MYKKLIAMIMTCIMLVSISPAVAAENASAKPTVEEILNEYHKAAFEAQYAAEADTSATYSPRSGLGDKTLEQETVDTLNAAGYEAYNVTPANYSALEDQLNTDFADMGLDPDGSYIIAIHGEDSDGSNTANGVSPRAIVPPPIDDGIGETVFNYTYNGTTYHMRYVTVTGNDNTDYRPHDDVDLSPEYISQFGLDFFNTAFSILLDYATSPVPTGSILSLLSLDSIDSYDTDGCTITLYCTAVWNRVFIQVWHSDWGWCTAQSSAYVTSKSHCGGDLYNPSTISYDSIKGEDEIHTHYSPYYFNKNRCKQDAVLAYLHNDIDHDCTGDIHFWHHGSIVKTLYEPFCMDAHFPP